MRKCVCMRSAAAWALAKPALHALPRQWLCTVTAADLTCMHQADSHLDHSAAEATGTMTSLTLAAATVLQQDCGHDQHALQQPEQSLSSGKALRVSSCEHAATLQMGLLQLMSL